MCVFFYIFMIDFFKKQKKYIVSMYYYYHILLFGSKGLIFTFHRWRIFNIYGKVVFFTKKNNEYRLSFFTFVFNYFLFIIVILAFNNINTLAYCMNERELLPSYSNMEMEIDDSNHSENEMEITSSNSSNDERTAVERSVATGLFFIDESLNYIDWYKSTYLCGSDYTKINKDLIKISTKQLLLEDAQIIKKLEESLDYVSFRNLYYNDNIILNSEEYTKLFKCINFNIDVLLKIKYKSYIHFTEQIQALCYNGYKEIYTYEILTAMGNNPLPIESYNNIISYIPIDNVFLNKYLESTLIVCNVLESSKVNIQNNINEINIYDLNKQNLSIPPNLNLNFKVTRPDTQTFLNNCSKNPFFIKEILINKSNISPIENSLIYYPIPFSSDHDDIIRRGFHITRRGY
jgi:hypothetical protein